MSKRKGFDNLKDMVDTTCDRPGICLTRQ